jgi:hypothetical protein
MPDVTVPPAIVPHCVVTCSERAAARGSEGFTRPWPLRSGTKAYFIAVDSRRPPQVNLEEKNSESSALNLASAKGHVDTVRCLVLRGADVNAVDRKKQTCLHRAAGAGKADCIEVLVSAGANVGAADKEGNTALHLAMYEQHADSCMALSEWPISRLWAQGLGLSALHQAIGRRPRNIGAEWVPAAHTCRVLLTKTFST